MLMTPGPTEVPPQVRKAMSRPIQNPDIDEEFADFYHDLEDKLKDIYDTDNDMLILGGEGILGLEASVASLISSGDAALCISNGIYGNGFADFVEMDGGDADLCDFPYGQRIDPEQIKLKVEKSEFKIATMVHCETPTGTLNNIEEILQILNENGIITVVDAVSSIAGTDVPVDDIDICIGGSQKCFSSPPGLTPLSVSEDAWDVIMDGEQNSFYTSLSVWKDMWLDKEYFPYTHLVSNLYALDESANMVMEEGLENVYQRHDRVAELCRERAREIGMDIYPEDEGLSSPTVTALDAEGVAKDLQREIHERNDILLATSLNDLENDILRIGHMGYNAREEKVRKTMNALEDALSSLDL